MVDLHIHTNSSDGDHDITTVLKMLNTLEVKVASITDHDSIGAYDQMKNIEVKKYFKGKIITGCEFKCSFEGVSIEVLGYGFDVNLIKKANKSNAKKINNMQFEIFELLKKRCDKLGLKYDKNVKIENGKFAAKTMQEVLYPYIEYNKKIFDEDILKTGVNFFRKGCCNKNSPLYIDESSFLPSASEVVQIIKKAGGISFVAHPGIYVVNNNLEFLTRILDETEVDGSECFYPFHSKQFINDILNLCKNRKKYVSGGSDYHGEKSKPGVKIGCGNVDEDKLTWINKKYFFNDYIK